jgi:uncharacterized protein (TIGR02453 family)
MSNPAQSRKRRSTQKTTKTRTRITPALFRFLRDLKKNNRREWFAENKERYESVVRDPLLTFVSEFESRLHRISPRLVADPRPVGGALFRIHRDVRFSKDKSPYKTHAGLRFPHEGGGDVHTPGYYLHLEPGSVFAGGGIWHPDPKTLKSVRDAIVEDPKQWKRVTSAKSFRATCRLGGDALQRPPRGYDPDHPFIEDIKRKDYLAYVPFTEKQACSPDFPKVLETSFRAMKPLLGFLAGAIGREL